MDRPSKHLRRVNFFPFWIAIDALSLSLFASAHFGPVESLSSIHSFFLLALYRLALPWLLALLCLATSLLLIGFGRVLSRDWSRAFSMTRADFRFPPAMLAGVLTARYIGG